LLIYSRNLYHKSDKEVNTCYSSTQEAKRYKDLKFKASLSYIVRPCRKTRKKQKEIETANYYLDTATGTRASTVSHKINYVHLTMLTWDTWWDRQFFLKCDLVASMKKQK
jgi:hypothetical protein